MAGQPAQHAGAVGADGRAGGHDRGGEVDQFQAAGRSRDLQADPPAVGAKAFHSDHDRHFVAVPTAGTSVEAADERLVDLDHAGQQLTVGADQTRRATMSTPGRRSPNGELWWDAHGDPLTASSRACPD